MTDHPRIHPDLDYTDEGAAHAAECAVSRVVWARRAGVLPSRRDDDGIVLVGGRDLLAWVTAGMPRRVPGPIDPDRAYAMAGAARAKGVALGSLGAAVADGRLPATREGQRWAILGRDLIAWELDVRPVPEGKVSVDAAAGQVGCSPMTVRLAIRRGDLSATFAHGRWRIDLDDLDDWWERTHPEPDGVIEPDARYRQADAARLAGITRQAIASGIARGQVAVVETPEGKRIRGADLIAWRRRIASEEDAR